MKNYPDTAPRVRLIKSKLGWFLFGKKYPFNISNEVIFTAMNGAILYIIELTRISIPP